VGSEFIHLIQGTPNQEIILKIVPGQDPGDSWGLDINKYRTSL